MDRNCCDAAESRRTLWSLSARRAWIEILLVYLALIRYLVALRKESVDRNHAMQNVIIVMDSRSPQGERG